MKPYEWLHEEIMAMVETLLGERGFTTPFYVVAATGHGNMMFVRINRNEKGGIWLEGLAEHIEAPKPVQVPLYCLFLDPRGGAPAILRIAAEDAAPERLKYVQ